MTIQQPFDEGPSMPEPGGEDSKKGKPGIVWRVLKACGVAIVLFLGLGAIVSLTDREPAPPPPDAVQQRRLFVENSVKGFKATALGSLCSQEACDAMKGFYDSGLEDICQHYAGKPWKELARSETEWFRVNAKLGEDLYGLGIASLTEKDPELRARSDEITAAVFARELTPEDLAALDQVFNKPAEQISMRELRSTEALFKKAYGRCTQEERAVLSKYMSSATMLGIEAMWDQFEAEATGAGGK